MKQLKRSIQIMILSMAVLLTCKFNVLAAGNSISFSDPTAKKGETVTVTVKVTSDKTALGAVDLNIVYDDDALEFSSGGSAVKGGSGSVRIADTASDSNTKTMTYQLTFKALKAGKSSLTVSNYEVYGFDESVVSMDHVGSASVEVTDESATLSKDASLKELKLSEGTLSPAFSPSVMNYTASVGADVSSVVVSGTTSHAKASITSITGNDNLKTGENTVRVSVTAESGATAVYTITITKAGSGTDTTNSGTTTNNTTATVTPTAKPEATTSAEATPEVTASAETTPGATGTPEVTGAESEYIRIGDKLLTPLALPEDAQLQGYTKGTLEYNNTTIEALVSDYMEVYVLYMVDTNGNEDYYVYYREIGEFTEFIKIDNGGDKFIVVLDGYPRDISIYGFEKTTIMINDKKVGIAWKYTDELISYSAAASEYYLVGGLSESGVATWYVYDIVQGTYQRYFVQPANLIEEETGPDLTLTEQEQQVKELNEALQKSKNSRLMVIVVLALTALFLLIATINLILKVRILQSEIDDLEDELRQGTSKNRIEDPRKKAEASKQQTAVSNKRKETQKQQAAAPNQRKEAQRQQAAAPNQRKEAQRQQAETPKRKEENRAVPPVQRKSMPKRRPTEEEFFDEEDVIPKEMEDAIIKEKMLGRGSKEDEFEESFKVRKTKATSQKPAPQKPVTKRTEKKMDEDDFDFEFIDLDDDK